MKFQLNSLKSNSPTFQQLILKLQTFFAERGAVIQQPYDVEVGAGTMAPETFLRVLGPNPYKVAYVQPSRRPADGRYGENPNRLFKHLQLQVILKPPPENVQDLYLESLGAIGIDLRQHDIKFEEDNWESPTLGAWGIGWQVMLDGLEVTQFTYFQQCGGVDLEPIQHHLPADAPRAERRRFPVVLFELDVMLPQVNADRGQRFQVKFLHILRRRLQDHLQLQVLEQPVGILAIASVRRTPRGLHISDLIRIRPEHTQKRLGSHRSRAHFDVIRLLNHSPTLGVKLLQLEDEFLKGKRIGFR